jgi:tRNA 2-thiouridine synthesizing protein E
MLSHTSVERDAESYLVHPEDWSQDIAAELATEEKIELTDAHWSVLEFVRDYWEDHKVIPDIRHVVSHMAKTQGIDKKAAKQQMFKLFPYGYVKQACKIAGMQRPRAWSTG